MMRSLHLMRIAAMGEHVLDFRTKERYNLSYRIGSGNTLFVEVLSVTILIRKRDLYLISLCCGLLVCASAFFLRNFGSETISVFSFEKNRPITVIVDAGHGGEDGGAVSRDGVAESHLNLTVALRLDALLRFSGTRTLMTRTEDISICDDGLDTIRKRKASDLQNRVKLVNETENPVLISIHQNSLPSSPVTHGAQVFWNPQSGAQELAENIQNSLNEAVNRENAKQAKPIPQTIYLTKHAQAPSVVVECGFLSNSNETIRLQQPSYQTKLAMSVAAGYIRCLKGEFL